MALFAASIYGTKTPPQKFVNFGAYKISVFESGISIYADGRKTPYWSISPLNDYILTRDEKKESLLTDVEFSEGKFETNLEKEKIEELAEAVEYFFGKEKLIYEIKKIDLAITYEATIKENTLIIERSLELVGKDVSATGITLAFSDDDLVYIPSTNTFVFYRDPQDVADFAQFVPGQINIYQGRENEQLVFIESGEVVLVNKYLPGVLLIKAQEGHKLIVDAKYGVILTEQQVTDNARIETKLTITYFEKPEEVKSI